MSGGGGDLPDPRLSELLADESKLLGPDALDLLRQLRDHELPFRRQQMFVRLAEENDKRIAARLADQLDGPDDVLRYVDGDRFILDLPETPPAIWGQGNGVVWMEGESLLLVGGPGVGKTTLAGQVVRARLTGGDVLGMPVEPTGTKVLYLAMDRPKQIARALARTLGDLPRDLLATKFAPWEGPPPRDLGTHPEALLEMADQVRADTIVVDSLKDAALGLEESRVGAGYNRARQLCLANGVQLLELHHNVKRGAEGRPPNTLEDVFGSRWLTAGAGSVVFLHGAAGDPVVGWRHLKQPAEEVGPFDVAHDHAAGVSQVYGALDLADLAARAGDQGLNAKGVATLMFEKPQPTKAEIMKAIRRLDALAKAGVLTRVDGDAAQQRATTWVTADTITAVDLI